MNYVEIVARQEELQTELQELQQARIKCAQDHEDVHASHKGGVDVDLFLEYAEKDADIIRITKGDDFVILSVEDFNEINQFLGKYNDAIFSYMSEITKTEEVVEEE